MEGLPPAWPTAAVRRDESTTDLAAGAELTGRVPAVARSVRLERMPYGPRYFWSTCPANQSASADAAAPNQRPWLRRCSAAACAVMSHGTCAPLSGPKDLSCPLTCPPFCPQAPSPVPRSSPGMEAVPISPPCPSRRARARKPSLLAAGCKRRGHAFGHRAVPAALRRGLMGPRRPGVDNAKCLQRGPLDHLVCVVVRNGTALCVLTAVF